MQKMTYWKIAYFLAPALATLVIEMFFSGWLMRSYDATLLGELSLTYAFFSWVFSCPLGSLGLVILFFLNYVNSYDKFTPYAIYLTFIVTTSALGYIQWFYLLPKWLRWRRERAEE